jgi:hypothetical protein
MKNRDGILQDLSDTSLVNAIERNLFESFKRFENWTRVEVHDDPDMLWLTSNIPFPLFNSILRARLSNPNSAIEAAIARARQRNVPLMWWTGPYTQPTDLGDTLATFGFIGEVGAGMAVNLNFLPEDMTTPPGLVIERVGDVETIEKFCRVICIGFESPEFVREAFLDHSKSIGLDSQSVICRYVGMLNGQPVASSSMFLGAGVAGIYNVATIPEARKRGIGTSMTLLPLLEARMLGYKAGILQASPMGLNIYRKLGFREYCKIKQYVWLNQ